jgi:hypothetical protein
MAYRVMVSDNGVEAQHGDIIEGDGLDAQLAVPEAATDVVNPPTDLRQLFMLQFAHGKYSEDSHGRRVWVEEVRGAS